MVGIKPLRLTDADGVNSEPIPFFVCILMIKSVSRSIFLNVYKFFKKTDRNYQKLMSDKLCGDCLIFRGIKNKI